MRGTAQKQSNKWAKKNNAEEELANRQRCWIGNDYKSTNCNYFWQGLGRFKHLNIDFRRVCQNSLIDSASQMWIFFGLFSPPCQNWVNKKIDTEGPYLGLCEAAFNCVHIIFTKTEERETKCKTKNFSLFFDLYICTACAQAVTHQIVVYYSSTLLSLNCWLQNSMWMWAEQDLNSSEDVWQPALLLPRR